MPDLVLFGFISSVLIYVSLKPLRHPGSHGFYRYFGWEGLAAVFVLNRRHWFDDPAAPHQILSWILLAYSIFLVAASLIQYRHAGLYSSQRTEAHLFSFERTERMVDSGIYKYIRHPMYGSLIFLGWGMCLKSPDMNALMCTVAATFFLTLTAKVEERENMAFFGQAYVAYREKTKMFIPFIA